VHIYQITDKAADDSVSHDDHPNHNNNNNENANAPLRTPKWTESHLLTPLRKLPLLIGIINLGALPPNTPLASLDAFILELGPAQNGYDTRGRGWNCGTYVLRILENLIEAGLVRSSLSPQELFLEGEVLGAKLERLRELRGMEGVPVVDVWR
jgi:hypothetical protein